MPSEFDDLTAVAIDRQKVFRPAWFRDLLGARLGLGDTFWIGNIGVGLVFVPLFFVISLVAQSLADAPVAAVLFPVFASFMALYHLLLTRAVFLCARRTPVVGGWRWVGVAVTFANFATSTAWALLFALGDFSGPL